MTWRVAKALLTLRNEVDKEFPDRDHASDGTIGNKAHQQLGNASDHNPWIKDADGVGVVRALDVDAGPGLNPTEAHDKVGDTVAEAARLAGKNGHPALKGGGYVIYEGQIASANSNPPWSWRKHTGDAHESHPHISVGQAPAAYDSTHHWGIHNAPQHQPQPGEARTSVPTGVAFPTLSLGDTGDFVKLVQRFLLGSARAKTLPFYGEFEEKTETAVRGYQRLRGLPITGKVNKDTWAPIRGALGI